MNTMTIVAVLAGTLSLSGCKTAPPEQASREELLEDNAHCLTVVVNSVPPGANVYGAWSGAPGTVLGTTPLEIKYTRYVTLGEALPGLERGGTFSGTAPVSETLETEFHADSSQKYTTRAYFKCYVLKEGYLMQRLYQQVDDSHFVPFQSFYGGRREFTVLLSPQPGVVTPVAQQTAQAQTK